VAATDNSIAEAAEKLENRLKTALPIATIPMSSVSWIGARFTTPNNAPWLRTSVFNLGIIDQDASTSYEINRAQFTIGVFYPKGTGRAAMATGEQIKNIFNAEIFDDLIVERVTVSPTSEPESSSWFGVNVQIIFTYEGTTL
jgi:hypothetical protein